MSLSRVSHVFLTSKAIRQWRKEYWALAKSHPMYDDLPAGLCFGEHFGHFLIVNAMHFDDRTRNVQFTLGWQTGQLLVTENQGSYERPGLWYLRPPGDRTELEPQSKYLERLEKDLRNLSLRPEHGKSQEGLILMTSSIDSSKNPLGIRAYIYSLERKTYRELVVQTDPLEHGW